MTCVTAGNFAGTGADYTRVHCDRYREAASARLDGEPLGVCATALHRHLTGCPDCARWEREATWLTRLLGLGTAAVPDLTAAPSADAVLRPAPCGAAAGRCGPRWQAPGPGGRPRRGRGVS